jgi:hypothetical protein
MACSGVLFCPACEAPGAVSTSLGYIADDGTTGTVRGVVCGACGYIAPDPKAPYVPDGGRLDIPPGMTAMEWFTSALRAAGCNPRRRP